MLSKIKIMKISRKIIGTSSERLSFLELCFGAACIIFLSNIQKLLPNKNPRSQIAISATLNNEIPELNNKVNYLTCLIKAIIFVVVADYEPQRKCLGYAWRLRLSEGEAKPQKLMRDMLCMEPLTRKVFFVLMTFGFNIPSLQTLNPNSSSLNLLQRLKGINAFQLGLRMRIIFLQISKYTNIYKHWLVSHDLKSPFEFYFN